MSQADSLSEVEGYNPFYPGAVLVTTAALIGVFAIGGVYNVLLADAVIGGITLGALVVFGVVAATVFRYEESRREA